MVIGLLMQSLDIDVREIRDYLDSELVVHQLNRVYIIWNPPLLSTFRRVRILKRYFDKVAYQHIPRNLNSMVDSLEFFFLNWYMAHN